MIFIVLNYFLIGVRSSETPLSYIEIESLVCQRTQLTFQKLHWSFRTGRIGWYFTTKYQPYIGFSFCGEMIAWNQYFLYIISRDDTHFGWRCHTHTSCRSIRQLPYHKRCNGNCLWGYLVWQKVADDELGLIRGTYFRGLFGLRK